MKMLETEIKKLNSQLEQLNNNFEAFFNNATASEKQLALPLEDENVVEIESAKAVTHESLKELCLTKSREDKENRPKIKAILSEKGAKLVDQLKDDQLKDVADLIGAL